MSLRFGQANQAPDEGLAAHRVLDRGDRWPARLAADIAYGSAENLGWLVHERGIEPHIPAFDKSKRRDGTFSRADFTYDHARDLYTCPAGKELRPRQKVYRPSTPLADEDGTMRYRASKFDSDPCELKARCTPTCPLARSCVQPTKVLATWQGTSPSPRNTSHRGGSGRRSRCSSRTSNAS
jgi:hypothetical protein